MPENSWYGLNTNEDDISDEIKNKVINNDSTINSTKNDTSIDTINNDNNVVENKDSIVNDNNDGSNLNNNNDGAINNKTNNKDITTNTNNNDNQVNSNSDIEVKINGKTVTDTKDNTKDDSSNKDKSEDNPNPPNESKNKTSDSDDIIGGIILPNQESYLSTRKQRAYYIKNDNLKKMESIVKKYGLDRSDMVNQSLEMFFKALDRLEKNRKEKV